ncbi:hypothetical protein EON76_02065 [bacterium]|nr:MAG: hypothetical protein EON76_02065 [bacterium]
MNEGNAKQQIVEGIKANSTILVTVNDSPSVDELSAALGLTLILNKLEKRATSIFSGAIPPAITFLDPAKTFESTVDSLRDFIIALDKEKADHLRYKVDGDVVKIFITPYRTVLSDKDLDFSQGDYNVEMVIALNVTTQDHLDKALSAHGRILHDAAVMTITTGSEPSTLGSADWREAGASSLCEMLVSLSEALKDERPVLDEQVATALLTGIVSATDRFSNDRTSSRVMTMAAQLMAAGANQQLIAAKLQEAHDIGPGSQAAKSDDTTDDSQPKEGGKDRKERKKDKKRRDDNSLTIDRKKEANATANDAVTAAAAIDAAVSDLDKNVPAGNATTYDTDAAIQNESVAIEEALEQAEPAKDVEKELSDQLAEVGELPQTAPIVADLEAQLNDASNADTMAPSQALDPAPAPGLPSIDSAMPGFESLDVPAPTSAPVVEPPVAAPMPQPEEPQLPELTLPPASDFITTHSGSDYISSDTKSSFDTPTTGIITGEGVPNEEAAEKTIDPFSSPLPPLPSFSNEPTTPVNQAIAAPIEPLNPVTPETVNVVSDQAFTPLAGAESLPSMPPQMPVMDMPALPPLPDFSTLPPLPSAPAAFDQPVGQSGGIASDKLGDIFGDAPTAAQGNTTDQPTTPSTPPPPGQFRIPGQ